MFINAITVRMLATMSASRSLSFGRSPKDSAQSFQARLVLRFNKLRRDSFKVFFLNFFVKSRQYSRHMGFHNFN